MVCWVYILELHLLSTNKYIFMIRISLNICFLELSEEFSRVSNNWVLISYGVRVIEVLLHLDI